jgi:ATP-dependent Lhr-like helicase
VRDLFAAAPTPTERAHARAATLLERYGVVSAAAARAEGLPGGFSAVYPVLKVMEDAGMVRRGWFVDGLDGAQFALPGAVDRLRACRDADPQAVTIVPAADPACPWGTLLPWPARAEGTPGPRRVAGAMLVSVGGRPVLYLDKGERSWVTLPGGDDPAALLAAIQGWIARQVDRWRTIRVEKIDGIPAPEHPHRGVLVEAGFAVGGTALERVRR